MSNFIENVDFDNDSVFSGQDLDIGWAYLQIKKLKEIEESNGGTSTITKENFVSKVNEQYILNKSANIADPSDSTVAKIGIFSSRCKVTTTQVKFKNFGSSMIRSRIIQKSSEALEKNRCQFVDSQWIQPSSSDKPPDCIKDSGRVELNDNRAITSKLIGQYNGKTKVLANGQAFLSKGTFEVAITPDKPAAGKCLGRVSSSGVSWGDRVHNYFIIPISKDTLNNNDVEIILVREGLAIRMYINGIECHLQIAGSQPEPISGSSVDALVQRGKRWSDIKRVYITEMDHIGKMYNASG